MTPRERSHPALIDGSRKRRIAAGAGLPVQEVSRLLKQHRQLAKTMKQLTKGGGHAAAARSRAAAAGRRRFGAGAEASQRATAAGAYAGGPKSVECRARERPLRRRRGFSLDDSFGVRKPMVVIRLARGGALKRPFYHIVVTRPPQSPGRAVHRAASGFFNPIATGGEERFSVDFERADYWLGAGRAAVGARGRPC